MKKLLKIVSVVILISTIAGCTLPQGSNVLHSEVSDDQIVEEAELIMDHLKDAADHEDYDAFEAHFDGKNEEDIRTIYESFVEGCLDKYDQFEGLVIDQIDEVSIHEHNVRCECQKIGKREISGSAIADGHFESGRLDILKSRINFLGTEF